MQTDFSVLSIDEELAMREHIMAIHDALDRVSETGGVKVKAAYSEVLARIHNEPNSTVRSCTLRALGLPNAAVRKKSADTLMG